MKANKKTITATPKPETKIKSSKTMSKGKPFDGDFSKLPSPRALQALVIKSIESGETFILPTTKEEALAMLGYKKDEKAA